MKIVENPKRVFKHISFICMTLFTSSVAIYSQLPDRLQDALNDNHAFFYSSGLIVIGIIGKFVDQFDDEDSKDD